MRPIAELLDFLTHQMSMQTEYQPLVILHLLTRSGWATRADLARTLAGNEIQALEEWDRILMDNPKRWLVGKHQILTYDKAAQTFRLNFDLALDPTEPKMSQKMSQQIRQACVTCEEAILTWVQRALAAERISEADALRIYRGLARAKAGGQQPQAEETDDAIAIAVEEYAMAVATTHLQVQYPHHRVTQQPYGTVGFDAIVGTAVEPVVYAKVVGTRKPTPVFSLSEADRNFALDHRDKYVLLMVYAIDFEAETHSLKVHTGAIDSRHFALTPQQWHISFFSAP